ncbi:MAG: hypothetical protein ACTHMA_17900, partial [Thermomicrobiales bacterium]
MSEPDDGLLQLDPAITGADDDEEESALPLSRQLARLAAIHRINRVATASLNLEEMLRTVVTVVAEAVGMDSCTVYLYS